MTAYRVVWDETWTRVMDIDLEEDVLRVWADVPIGPIPERMICAYLEEEVWAFPGESWHPCSKPGERTSDEVADLDVEYLREQGGEY